MRRAYVVGTCDTKGVELAHVRGLIEAAGIPAVLIDVSTSGTGGPADVAAEDVAAHHPEGAGAVFTGDRGRSVAAMALAAERFLLSRQDLGGLIGLGGSGNTALVTPAMRALPVGVPKVMVSTLASGNVAPYVGASDIHMVHAVADVAGLNSITRKVLGNAAHALAGMMARGVPEPADVKPAVALTMFGVTTPCVTRIAKALADRYDCIVFHATGTGGRTMEKLVDSGLVAGMIDVTTTEIADELVGGILSAGPDRLGAAIRTGVPYVGSCGALDMVNFGPLDTVPERYRNRHLHVHNPQVTLMRTTAEESARIGRWIGEKLNACRGEVRFLIPEGGISAIDVPGQPFHDPAADAALFAALEATIVPTARRRLLRLPHAINDDRFADALVEAFLSIAGDAAPTGEPK